MFSTCRAFALVPLCLLGVAVVPLAKAQYDASINVSRCYSNVLQHSEVWESDLNTHYRLLSSMTKEDYDSLKANSKLSAFIEGIPLDASWDVARAQATKLVQKRDEELLQTQHTYSAVLRLDDQATAIFRECIRGMVANSAYGLFYYVTHTEADTAQLQIEWKWIEGKKISVKTSTIDNGYIAGTSPKQRTLYPATWANKIYSPDISEGQNFIVKFDDPNKDINITLVTSPEVRYWPIVIPHLALRKKCVTTWTTSANDIPFHRAVSFDPAQHLTGVGKGGGSGFSYSENIDGVVTDVTCDKLGMGWIELDLSGGASVAPGYGVGTNVAKCDGWLNANPRQVVMTYSWKKDHTDCDKEEPWPMPAAK